MATQCTRFLGQHIVLVLVILAVIELRREKRGLPSPVADGRRFALRRERTLAFTDTAGTLDAAFP